MAKKTKDFEERVAAFHDAMEAEFGIQWSQRKMGSDAQLSVRKVVEAMDKLAGVK